MADLISFVLPAPPALFAITDARVGEIITGAFSLASLVVTAILTVLMAKMKKGQEEQAELAVVRDEKVAEVAIQAKKAAIEVSKVAVQAQKAAVQVEKAAIQVSEVKQTLEVETSATKQQLLELTKAAQDGAIMGKATHEFVNSLRAVELEANRDQAIELLGFENIPKRVMALEHAERKLTEHRAAQARVDAQPGTDAQKQGNGGHAAPVARDA